MAKLRFTKRAVDDLANIWEYTDATWSERQADKYYRLLIQACREVAKSPQKGKSYDQVDTGIMGYVAYRHIIFYHKISGQEIEILRILHGQMDIKNQDVGKPER